MPVRVKQWLGDRRWDAERFGWTPSGLAARVSPTGLPVVLCVSVPKAGTHLLERAICRTPGLYRRLLPTVNDENAARWNGLPALLQSSRGGQVLMAHVRHTTEVARAATAGPVRTLFMIRDPRDIVLSQASYIYGEKNHPRHALFAAAADDDERIALAIRGSVQGGLPSVGERLREYAGWLSSGALVLRFEDLIGPRGGGQAARQEQALASMYEFFDVELDSAVVEKIREGIFSAHSPTFSKGIVGRWRDRFDDRLRALFKETAADELIAYGYADDEHW